MAPSITKEALKTYTVEELVVMAQGQDSASHMMALEELVARHQKTVYAMLYQLAPERTDIADLTQDVLLKMCRSIRTLRNPKTFKYWLNRIVTNLFYDELRKAPRRLSTISMDAPQYDEAQDGHNPTHDIPDSRDVPDKILLQGELDVEIRKAINELPEQFRTMIVLREVQGLSYEEIASLTQVNLGTVKSRLARARLRLQELLQPYLKEMG
jgi:RNA polymerase sigma-70 factor (ECF subfamily)